MELNLDDLQNQSATFRQRYIEGSVTRLMNVLRDAEISLEAQLAARINRLSALDRTRYIRGRDMGTQRLEALLEQIQEFGIQWRRLTSENTNLSVKELAAAEIAFAEQSLAIQGVLGTGVSTAQVVAATYAQPLEGRHLRDLFRDAETNVKRTINRTIRSGFIIGQTTDEIVRALVGDPRIPNRSGDLSKHRRGIAGLTRTALNHTAARASLETFRALDVAQYQWISSLDGRTSTICQALDSKIFSVEGNNPVPPAHYQCRSSIAPYLGEIAGETRASKGAEGGRAVPNQSYGEWLRTQPRSFIEDTMGRTRAKLFLDGGLKIERFADIRGLRELTIDELRVRHAAVFQRIGA